MSRSIETQRNQPAVAGDAAHLWRVALLLLGLLFVDG